MTDDLRPIGVFDSGVGGISVLSELVRLMPNENFIYFGDSANAPYGTKTLEELGNILGFSKERILVLEEYWPNAIEETYTGMAGYIYSAEKVPQMESLKDIPFAVASTVCVPVQNCEYVPDAYEA